MSTTGRSSAPEQLEFDFCQSSRLRADHEPLLTIAEACSVFNLKPHVLRRAIKARSIPSYRLGNGRIRLRASDINAAIQASRSGRRSMSAPDREATRGPFADWAGVYRRRGYWPRPITPGTKACHVRDWQKPDLRIAGGNARLVADVARPFRHRPAHGQPISRRHYARRPGHRPRRICAPRARFAHRCPQRPHREEGRGLLRSRARSPPAIPSSRLGAKRASFTARSPSACSSGSSASSRRRFTPIPGSLTAGLGDPCTRSASMNCR